MTLSHTVLSLFNDLLHILQTAVSSYLLLRYVHVTQCTKSTCKLPSLSDIDRRYYNDKANQQANTTAIHNASNTVLTAVKAYKLSNKYS